MLLEFPDDPTCWALEMQYMLSPTLLIAPVFNEQGHVRFYLPQGRWTDFWTGEEVVGSRWLDRVVDYFAIPIYVRENSLLPMGPVESATRESSLRDLELRVYAVSDETKLTLYDDDKIVHFHCVREGDHLTLTADADLPTWRVRFIGLAQAQLLGKENQASIEGNDLLVTARTRRVQLQIR